MKLFHVDIWSRLGFIYLKFGVRKLDFTFLFLSVLFGSVKTECGGVLLFLNNLRGVNSIGLC